MTGRELVDVFPKIEHMGPIFGHQGGWDEVLLVVGPLATIAVLLWVANRRVAAKLAEQAAEDQPED